MIQSIRKVKRMRNIISVEELKKKMDKLDRIAIILYRSKHPRIPNANLLEDDLDYTLSIIEENEKYTTVLLEEPVYPNSSIGWKVARYIIKISNGEIIEYHKDGECEYDEPYSFVDLSDEEFKKKRVYNFLLDGILYVDRKQPIIDERGRRNVETIEINYDYENKEVLRFDRELKPLSHVLPVAKYQLPFSKPGYGAGEYRDFMDDYHPPKERKENDDAWDNDHWFQL